MRAGQGAGASAKCAEPARQRAKTTVAFTDRSRNQCKRLVTEDGPENEPHRDQRRCENMLLFCLTIPLASRRLDRRLTRDAPEHSQR